MKAKRILSFLVVIVMTMSLFATIPAFAAGEEIGLTLDSSTPAIGNIITATVFIKNIPTIASLQITLGYNSAALTLWNITTDAAATNAANGINAAAFLALKDPDGATAFSTVAAGDQVDVAKGLIDWNCSTEIANPDTGEFIAYTVPTPATALTVMTLRFKVIGAGSANLKLAKKADGGNYTAANPLGIILKSVVGAPNLTGLTETLPSLTIAGVTPIPAQVKGPIVVLLNGTAIKFDQPPIIENGRTLVPMRAIFEAMDAKVEWDNANKIVNATKGNAIIIMQIGNNVITVNGKQVVLDVAPKIVNDRTLVPARAVAESLNADVSWDDNTRTVYITTK